MDAMIFLELNFIWIRGGYSMLLRVTKEALFSLASDDFEFVLT